MKLRTKLLAIALAASISVPFAFTSCDENDKVDDAAGTVNNVVENVVENLGSNAAFTKEYFEQNKYDVVMASVDYEEIFGASDDLFAFFRNEKLKNGLGADLDFDVDGMDLSIGVDALKEPMKAKIDISMDGEGNPIGAPIGASVYFDKEMLSVESDLFLGESAIGLKFESIDVMLEKLANSKLGAMLKIPSAEELNAALENAGVTDEYLERVKNALSVYLAENGFEGMYSKFETMVSSFAQDAYGEVSEAVVTDYNGNEVDAYALNVEIDTEDYIDLMNMYLDIAADSYEDVMALTKEIATINEDAYAAMDAAMEAGLDMESLKSELLAVYEMMDINGNSVIYLDKADGSYVKCDMEVLITVEDVTAVISGSEYVVDNGVLFDLNVAAEDEIINLKGGITSDSNADKYSVVMTMDVTSDSYEGGELTSVEAGFDVDKNAGTYNLYADIDAYGEEMNIGANGKIAASANEFSFTFDEVYADDVTTELPENKITLSVIDDVAAHENVKDIFELDENELFGIFSRINAIAGN